MNTLAPPRPDLECGTTELAENMIPDAIRGLLATTHEGRLYYQSGRGPRCIVVNYLVSHDGLLITLPDYNDAAHCLAGREVSLEATGQSRRSGKWTVTTTGTAHRLAGEPCAPPATGSSSGEQWPSWVMTSVFLLSAEGLRWRMDQQPLPT